MTDSRYVLTNQDLPRGVVRTKAGHLRYTSPKEKRGKYVHREVIEILIDETPWSVRIMLPWPYEVHHQDYNKENNEPWNLLLLSNAVHSALTADRARHYNGRFQPKWGPPPPWTLFNGDMPALSEGEEVPF